jgi:putative DNA methylase
VTKRKLIEVALPLEEINKQSAREKSIRHGHPSTLHLWWARRPLATARAVLFAQLVDDPGNREEEFREEAVRKGEPNLDAYVDRAIQAERQRLFRLIDRMVNWDNVGDQALFDELRAEIFKSTNGNPPPILDPFAGGGTIPLEAQRLGLEAHASDINPVAVLINKALVEYPPRFANRRPVFPGADAERNDWPGATGLAEDVRQYGKWMREEAEQRIGWLYPSARLPSGDTATVVAWIWARTVPCPNPACAVTTPLVRSWWLGKKRGKEAYIVPRVVDGQVEFDVAHDPKGAPTKDSDGTIGRRGARCISCGSAMTLNYIRDHGRRYGLGQVLVATVAEGDRSRIYLPPSEDMLAAAQVPPPAGSPLGNLAANTRDFKTPNYGMTTFASLFTNRQLTALITFSDLVEEARLRALSDARAAGIEEGDRLDAGGDGALAYADAIATYLGLGVSRYVNFMNALCTWRPDAGKEQVGHLFTRQAIPMVWDFAESNILSNSAGGWNAAFQFIPKAIERLPAKSAGVVRQSDAASRDYGSSLISTDPPYYDNIGYSDLSDFFYVWLRRSLREVHTGLFTTVLVPKEEELVANPYRHGGPAGAKGFFETGFQSVFANARQSALPDYPIAVYYAFKQSETVEGEESSRGWETILGSMVGAGWTVTATWPMRSELANRMIASGTNALASSIVLALRPRSDDAPIADRRGFLAELKLSLANSLRDLHQGTVAPVDMAQAAIGPGMAIFSKYSKVVQPDGTAMSVHDALVEINSVLDSVRREQEGDFDSDTRWCVTWFEQHGFDFGPFGDAHTLATAKATTLDGLSRSGIVSTGGGKVKLFSLEELNAGYDPRADDRVSLWEVVLHLAKALTETGLADAGRIFAAAVERGFDMTEGKALADLLFVISEKRGSTKIAIAFNQLASAWSEIVAASRDAAVLAPAAVEPTLDFDSLEE